MVPLSTPATCRWTVPLKGQSHRFEDDAAHLCFCDPVPGKLDDGKVAPPYGPLDLVEADHEGGGGGAAHPRPLHGGEPSALGTNHTITSNPLTSQLLKQCQIDTEKDPSTQGPRMKQRLIIMPTY